MVITKLRFKESDNTDLSVSPYASSKKQAKVLCHVYHHLHNISIHCLRFFTVVGPRQRPDLAVHKFVKAILSGQARSAEGEILIAQETIHLFTILLMV